MMTLSRISLVMLIAAAAACRTVIGAEGRPTKKAVPLPVPVLQSWDGKVADPALRQVAPASGFLLEPEPWAALWKAWREQQALPAVDFQKQMVLVHVAEGPNQVGCSPVHDGKGNVRALAMSTLMAGPGFGYLLQCIAREGVQTVNGQPLPGVKVPAARPPGPKPSSPKPGAAPGADPTVEIPSANATAPGNADAASVGAADQQLPVKKLKALTPKRAVFEAASWLHPLVLNSEKQAADFFDAGELARLREQVDFARHVVLVFAWRGSGQDRLEVAVAESYPEQIFFTRKPGRTKDLRPHVEVYALRANVKWSVK